ncbi:MAG: LamG domain-containing protein, partial [Candidatus Aenigmarchaeota archaeon]|nr:LamG domain-containing protein [Candidatus Aenigmarchaeota archaeon]
IKLYIDGTLKRSFAYSSSANILTSEASFIVGNDDGGRQNFNGIIDEVRIFNRALSAEEINASYNAGLYRLETNITNLTEGTYTYTAYAQDLAGNVNQTEMRTLIIGDDIIYPQYSLNQTNSTEAGTDVLFSLYWTDNDLAGYIFSFDNCTGTFENDSYVAMTGTGNWSNVSKQINSTVGCMIQWQVYANNTAGNMNTSEIFNFTTISSGDSTYPTITIQSPANDTYSTQSIWFNVTLNETGSWCGYSLDGAANVTMDGSGMTWYKENLTMTESSHNVTFSCNDTEGNMNASAVTEYFTIDSIYPTYTTVNPSNNSIFYEPAEFSFNITTSENTNMTVYYWNSSDTYTLTNTSYTQLPKNTSIPLSVGIYNWNFSVCDEGGLCNQSDTYTFSVYGGITYDEFDTYGSTSNLN